MEVDCQKCSQSENCDLIDHQKMQCNRQKRWFQHRNCLQLEVTVLPASPLKIYGYESLEQQSSCLGKWVLGLFGNKSKVYLYLNISLTAYNDKIFVSAKFGKFGPGFCPQIRTVWTMLWIIPFSPPTLWTDQRRGVNDWNVGQCTRARPGEGVEMHRNNLQNLLGSNWKSNTKRFNLQRSKMFLEEPAHFILSLPVRVMLKCPPSQAHPKWPKMKLGIDFQLHPGRHLTGSANAKQKLVMTKL